MKPYFSHDEGARNDPKLVQVMMDLGHEGKSVYWDLVEMLYEQGGYLMLAQCKGYAFALRTSCDLILKLVNDFGLFVTDGEKFWSQTALERMEMRASKSERRAAAGAKGGKAKAEREAAAKALVEQSHSNATAVPQQSLAIKEKEIKEKSSDEDQKQSSSATQPLPDQKPERRLPPPPDDAQLFTADTWVGLTNPATFAAICTDLRLPIDLDRESYRAAIQDKMRSLRMEAIATTLRSWISSYFMLEKKRGPLLTLTVGLPATPTPRNELPKPGQEQPGQVLAFEGESDDYVNRTRRATYQQHWPAATIHIITPR